MSRFDWLELSEQSASEAPREPLLSRRPDDASSYYQAARKLREAGHFKSAADYYQRCVGLNERNYAGVTEMIDTLVRAGLFEDAERYSVEALENARQVPLLYASRALVLAHRGALTEAWPLSQTAFDHTDHWYAQFVWAELQLRAARENLPEVVQALDALVERHTDHWELHFLSAWILLQAPAPAHAACFAADAAHLKPRSVASWINLGDCFFALRLYDQALFYYQRAIDIETNHPLALERQRRVQGCATD